MIAKLRGIIDQIGEDYVIIDVSGVGYIVFCPTKVLNKLSAKGELDEILIETIVREDQITLYGFKEEKEKYWFGLLLKVQGVGAKTALKGLSILTPEELEIKYKEALLSSIKNFWSTETQKKLKLQREKINDTYSWDVRSVEWKNFLDKIRISKR